MSSDLKTTPLNTWHRQSGANMASFGGYDMPLWYDTGVKKEHLAVLESAGLFDTSHMACVKVTGPDALSLLQFCHTRELSGLKQGRCVYGAILNGKGHVIDDAIVYHMGPENFMVCVNAGMGGAVSSHLLEHKQSRTVTVEDLTDQVAKIDVQGRNSARILAKILHDPATVFGAMPYFSFKGHFLKGADQPVRLQDGTDVLISRSGYTGEFGFEIFVDPDRVVALWENLLAAGKEYGLIPCGLGARDSLRAGAGLPLSHQDIGERKFVNHPWMFALAMAEDGKGFTKDFLGKEALLDSADAPFTVPFVGENLRKVGAGPDTQVIDADGESIGMVLTCATDMGIGLHEGRILSIASPDLPEGFKAKGLSCGFLLADRQLQPGEKLVLRENKRKINVAVAENIRPHRTARLKITNFTG
ncbi:MAG: aminomethyl transferase family protein [Desulfobacteraceae bacterium]|nr:aminomethyl transferase family protein [Desulfobacteraceae bacterium]